MKVIPGAAPAAAAPAGSTTSAQEARARAISMIQGQQAQAEAVPNPTRISPEELGAIRQPAQSHSTEETVAEQVPAESKAPESPASSEQPLSSQYAVLARKEKAIRQREAAIRAREAAIRAVEDAARVPAATPPQSSFDESKYVQKDALTSDPFRILTELGLTYDQLTEMALNGPKPESIALSNEVKALREELKALKGETESTKKSVADQQAQSYKQAINQITLEAKNLINNNPAFETIKETNSISDVVELIDETFKKDGILLTVEEAALEVEDYLLEEAMKLSKIKKIQQRWMPKETPAPVSKTTEQPKQQQLKTLTNSVGTSRQLSARERALLAFEGKLKS